MQIQIRFYPSELRLPMAHQYEIQSLLYHSLAGDPEYAAFLHDQGYASGDRLYRLFTFGRLTGRYQVEGKTLVYREGVSLAVRSVDDRFVHLLAWNFAPESLHQLCGQKIRVKEYVCSDEPVRTEHLEVLMRSPVTVHRLTEEGKTRYYTPLEPEFAELVTENAGRKWHSYYGIEMPGQFHIEPLKVDPRRDKVVTTYKGLYITGWLGKYRLQAPADVLKFLYQCGLGARNAQGFGMFDPIRSNR